MNLIDSVAGWLGYAKKSEMPTAGQLMAGTGGISTYPMTFPGWDKLTKPDERKTAETAMSSAWASSAVQTIMREFSTADLNVFKQIDGDDLKISDHPSANLWKRPNKFIGRGLMMQFLASQYLFFGRCYLFLAPTGNTITELWPIPAFMVKPVYDDERFIAAYEFKSSSSAKTHRIDSRYIVYSRLPHPLDLRSGWSPLSAAVQALELDKKHAKWNEDYFGEGNAVPPAIATLKQDVSNSDFKRISDEIFAFFGKGQRRIAVTRSGDMDFKVLQQTMKDMEFLAGRKFNEREIYRAFGIPGGMWEENATEANARHAKSVVIENIVWPMLQLLQDDINAQWFADWHDEDIYAQFDDIRPRNVDMQLRQTETRKGYWTVGELRAEDGKPLLGDGRDDMLISEIGTQMAQKAAPTVAADSQKPETLANDLVGTKTAAKAAPSDLSVTERALYDAILAVFEKYGVEAAGAVFDGIEFLWEQFSQDLKAAILPIIREAMQAEYTRALRELKIEVDEESAPTAASEWARQHAGELEKKLSETTRKLFANTLAEFQETPGMTLDAVAKSLEGAFGPNRAESIAITEITRSAAAGVSAYQKTLVENGIETTRFWNTNADALVCPICGPMNNKPESEWGDKVIPAHSRCRCFYSLKLKND